MMLTTHPYLVPRLRRRGAIPPLPHASSWRVVGPLYLYIISKATFKVFDV
jgi:hypothetical protein